MPGEAPQQVTSQTPAPMMPEMGRQGSREYSDAHYKFLSTLIESESARSFYLQIVATDFSHQCVNGYHKLLTNGFDKNAILASNTDIRGRKIDFEIAMNKMVLECHESDIQNPAFLTFNENILQTFVDFISRSQNADERRRLLRSEYGVTDETQSNPQQQQQGNRLGRRP
jgi:hypothetical protein